MADNGDAMVAHWVAGLRSVSFAARSAGGMLAGTVQAQLSTASAAGHGPDGEVWEPRLDGDRALPGAGGAIDVSGSGSTIVATVEVPYSYHQTKRPMLPTGQVPAAMSDAMAQRVGEAIGEALDG